MSDCRCRIADVGLQMSDCRCRIADVGLQMSDCRCRIADVGLQMSDCRCRIIYRGLEFAATAFNPKSDIWYPPSEMEVSRNCARNQFEIVVDGQTSVAQYQLDGAQMTITHIVVPPPIEGQGVASALAQFIIQTAREQNLTIVPQCPFMAAYFRRHPDNSDVLAA